MGVVDLDYLVYTDSLLYSRADCGSVNDGLGYADVLTVTRLGSSTVFTLDVVNWAVGDQLQVLRAMVLRTVVMVMVVTVVVAIVVVVGIDLKVSIRVGGARRSGLLLLELFAVVLFTTGSGMAVTILFTSDTNLFLAVALLVLLAGRKVGTG